MKMTEVSKEYGTALFMLACENNKKEEYAEGLSTLKDAFLKEPEYLEFLSSPGIPLSERLDALSKAFSDILPDEVLSYIMLMCEKGKISCFFDSAEEYLALLDASKKVTKAKVTTVIELNEEEKEKISRKLEDMFKTAVEIEYEKDEAILGGILIEADGKIIDGSLKTRLRDIKEVINK